jgi:hypothetical protein
MSVLNCGSITSGALGAGLTKLYGVTSDDYTHLFSLVATCITLTMAPAPFLWLLPSELDAEKEEKEGGEGGEAQQQQQQAGAEGGKERPVGQWGDEEEGEGEGQAGAIDVVAVEVGRGPSNVEDSKLV